MKNERGALKVALGIFSSRVAGLVRERVFAHYLGNSDAAGVFRAALRIPNFLQNLFGEGVLSASFIPVYSRLLSEGAEDEASRLASLVGVALSLLTSVLVLLGVLATPVLIEIIAPGFEGATKDLTIEIVRLLFPGVGLLVLSAWCLGILNSHRRFFLSYFAPVLWNLAMIFVLWWFGRELTQSELTIRLAWGATIGSALQFLVQLPTVLQVAKGLKWSMDFSFGPLRQVFRQVGPVLMGRGVVQLSAYLDGMISSFLGAMSVAGLAYAQTIYLLPISLFGMSVAAAELPELSRTQVATPDEAKKRIRERLGRGLKSISLFVVPSTVACVILGQDLVTLLYRTGQFGSNDTKFVWLLLMGYGFGMLASTWGRLFSSAFYAMGDTKTPLKISLIRVSLSAAIGLLLAFPMRPHGLWLLGLLGVRLPELPHIEVAIGAMGLTLGSSLAGWLEMTLLRRKLEAKIATIPRDRPYLGQVVALSLISVLVAKSTSWLMAESLAPWPSALVVVGVFGGTYLGLASAMGLMKFPRLRWP